MRLSVPSLFAAFLFACTPPAEPTEAPAGEAAAAADIAEPAAGRAATGVDPAIVKAAATTKDVDHVKIRLGADGGVTKLAIYHNDPDQVPEPVRKLAEQKFPDAKVRYYETEYQDGNTVYEVEVETGKKKDKKTCEIKATAEGKEIYTECRLPKSEVPKEIADAIKQLLPKGMIAEAETKIGPGVEEVSLEVAVEGRIHYLYYTTKGELRAHYVRLPGFIEIPAP